MAGVLTGGREACVACSPNFKPLARLVAEISAEKSFPIVTVSQGPTIGFRCKPAVSVNDAEETQKNHKNTEQRTFKYDKCPYVYSYILYLNDLMRVHVRV